MPVQLELGPLPAPSRFLTMVARPVLTTTSVCAAERAGGFGATANDLGVVEIAIAATVGLSIGGRGRSSEDRGAPHTLK